MEDEKRAHRDAYFQGELYSLKLNIACIASLLRQTLRKISGEGPSNRFVTLT